MVHLPEFTDRVDAGRALARLVSDLRLEAPVVLALPRGGVPVAFEIAVQLDATLDVLVVRKVGAPRHEELGVGAIAEGGVRIADAPRLRHLGISDEEFNALADTQAVELERRVVAYRGGRALPVASGRDIVLVDDGLATGVTAHAAVLAARRLAPRRVVLAAPTCAADTARRLEAVADAVVCACQPEGFVAVGQSYRTFEQTTDAEVIELLQRAQARHSAVPDDASG